MTNRMRFFLVVLFSLAAIGLVVTLQNNPTMVLLSIALSIIVIFVLNHFLGAKSSTDSRYRKALRKQKHKGKNTPTTLQHMTRLKKTSRHNPFKVIEGNKGKPPRDKEKKSQLH